MHKSKKYWSLIELDPTRPDPRVILRWLSARARADARPRWTESSNGPATVQAQAEDTDRGTDRTHGVLDIDYVTDTMCIYW